MNPVEKLLAAFDAYASLTGKAEATVSMRFLGRSSRIRELRAGGDIGILLYERIIRKLSEAWPEGAPWSEYLDRPLAVVEMEAAA